MPNTVFVSYPTTDVERSKAFYTAVGTTFNPQLSDDNSACLTWNEHFSIMVLKRDFMAKFTDKQLADPTTTVQTQVSLFVDSREDVDRAAEAGLAAGGAEPRPAEDHGFMYTRDLEDPDGNVVAFMYAEPQA